MSDDDEFTDDPISQPFEGIEALTRAMEESVPDHRIRVNEEVKKSQVDFISDGAWLCWSKGDLRFYLVESRMWREWQTMKLTAPKLYGRLMGSWGRFNGYVRFPKLPVVAPGIHGIIDYVPVHGGITFFQEWWDGSVTYGFDTGHAISMDKTEIISDVGWMMEETESLARSIQIAARFERFYLNALDDNDKKARVIQRMGQFLPVGPTDNMNIMLNLLSGEL